MKQIKIGAVGGAGGFAAPIAVAFALADAVVVRLTAAPVVTRRLPERFAQGVDSDVRLQITNRSRLPARCEVFDGIPHMLLPVVTDMSKAALALKWAVDEMERRYQLFANAGTKNITTYNAWVERVHRGEARPPKPPTKTARRRSRAVESSPAAA